jgi:hypothetical protein
MCQDGTVASFLLSSLPRARRSFPSWAGFRACAACGGRGTIEEAEADLRSAGVVLWDSSEEDFRSLPLHWSP